MAFFYFGFIGILLCFPENTIHYAFQGLVQWATGMVPTLFPFMMISSMMIYTGIDRYLTKLINPFLSPFFPCSKQGFYAIVMGFLCGFPMGAKATCDLRKNNRITKDEAEYLLAFCNNIGPTYFLGIIFPLMAQCGYNSKILLLFGLYGIPLLYGILFGKIRKSFQIQEYITHTDDITPVTTLPITTALRLACLNSIQSILLLGGYVTFINAFRVLPELINLSNDTSIIVGSFLEIVYGIPGIYQYEPMLPSKKAFWIMLSLSFSGICCMLQTSSIIDEELSIKKYLFHKCIITGISAVYYSILFL